jgi:hypothetical protein
MSTIKEAFRKWEELLAMETLPPIKEEYRQCVYPVFLEGPEYSDEIHSFDVKFEYEFWNVDELWRRYAF